MYTIITIVQHNGFWGVSEDGAQAVCSDSAVISAGQFWNKATQILEIWWCIPAERFLM